MMRRSLWILCAKPGPGSAAAAAAAANAAADAGKASTAAEKSTQSAEDADSTSTSTTASDAKTSAAEGDVTKSTKVDADGKAADDAMLDLEVEPMRWEQTELDHRIVDEKGEYIVSKVKWPTGDVAYQTPAPPNHLQARFGYQIVQVKKHQSWWEHYRKVPRFSWAHMGYQGIFMFGLAWLMTFLHQEVQSYQNDMMSPGNLAGETLGKGRPGKKDMKIEVTDTEQREFLEAMQESYMNATDVAYRGSKNYQMKQIPRPTEFDVKDYLRS